jgi:uncharacterized DUF497 family protein
MRKSKKKHRSKKLRARRGPEGAGVTVLYGDAFEWNSVKAIVNERDHHVTFEEAATAFDDPHSDEYPDATEEGQFILFGMSNFGRKLLVVHCERITDSGRPRTRIIQARVAHKTEAVRYALGDVL